MTPETPHAGEAFVCETCGARWYYTRHRCPDCGETAVATYALGEGELLAVTEVHVTPPDVRSPNHLGLARFDGVQLVAQLVDGSGAVGDTVAFDGEHELRGRRLGSHPRLRVLDPSER